MKRISPYWWLGGLVVLLLALGALAQRNNKDNSIFPRARYADKTPLGGKGLHLLLQKQGYAARLQTASLKDIPGDAKVWLLLDPETVLSNDDGKVLLKWVEQGGTLIWSNWQELSAGWWDEPDSKTGQDYLRHELHVTSTDVATDFIDLDKSLYPIIHAAPITARDYGASVHNSYLSSNTFIINNKNFQALAGSGKQLQLALIKRGKGRVIIAADAMMFTNYGMSHGDTAVLVTNLIRRGVPKGAAVYFDERTEANMPPRELPHTLSYYLWQPPMRWVLFQLLFAGLLLWAFYGRRLGRPEPIPRQQPVTRASQFAVAMAGLYQKARRPKVAQEVLAQEFRRLLVRRTGASPLDDSGKMANRCHEMTGLPRDRIKRLLDQLDKPARSDADVLRLVREMEEIQQKLGEK